MTEIIKFSPAVNQGVQKHKKKLFNIELFRQFWQNLCQVPIEKKDYKS